MKRKFLFIIITVICAAAVLSGCALFNNPENSSSGTQVSANAVISPMATSTMDLLGATPSQSATLTPAYSSSGWPSPGTSSDPVTYQDEKKVTVEYYDVNKDAQATATYTISGDVSVGSAMDAVNDIYIQNVIGSDSIKTNTIIFKDGNIYIDFTDSIYGLNLGSTGEAGVLNSIADAYLNNVEGINAVYYSVDGADYSTGHLEFSKDKPYKTK